MKAALTICSTAILAAVAAAIVVSQRAADLRRLERAAAQANWETERASLEAQLERLRTNAPSLAPPSPPRAPESSPTGATPSLAAVRHPAAILQLLAQLQPSSSPNPSRTLRRALHELETLADLGPRAIPPIDAFLGERRDVPYLSPAKAASLLTAPEATIEATGRIPESAILRIDPGVPPEDQARRLIRSAIPSDRHPSLDFVLPPTLRFGLFDVLSSLGGDDAERALAETLRTTVRSAELAYLSRLLEQLTPGKYRDLALTAARDLLRNPVPRSPDSTEDPDSAGYLYGILLRSHDPAFVPSATRQLVSGDGTIDRWALTYLVRTLGEDEAVPVISAAIEQWKTNPSEPGEPGEPADEPPSL